MTIPVFWVFSFMSVCVVHLSQTQIIPICFTILLLIVPLSKQPWFSLNYKHICFLMRTLPVQEAAAWGVSDRVEEEWMASWKLPSWLPSTRNWACLLLGPTGFCAPVDIPLSTFLLCWSETGGLSALAARLLFLRQQEISLSVTGPQSARRRGCSSSLCWDIFALVSSIPNVQICNLMTFANNRPEFVSSDPNHGCNSSIKNFS